MVGEGEVWERSTFVIGVDPGPTPGICALLWVDGVLTDYRILQINAKGGVRGAVETVVWLLANFPPRGVMADRIAVERFVVGRKSVVTGSQDAGQITRDMVGAVQTLGGGLVGDGGRVVMRSAAEVKPWATDERLKKAGLLGAVLGMPHARDAVRHALFCAVSDLGVADPLSRKARVAK